MSANTERISALPIETPNDQMVFINNSESVLAATAAEANIAGQRGVTGDLATLTKGVSPRQLWHGFENAILPNAPEAAFVDYVRSYGLSGNFYVPAGLQENLSILDGMADPKVGSIIKGKPVLSYISTSALHDAAVQLGGEYIGGHPGSAVKDANDKALFSTYAEQCGLAVADHDLVKGSVDAAKALVRRLAKDGRAFLRLTHAAGGHGNLAIEWPSTSGVPQQEEIQHFLQNHSGIDWSNSPAALIEEHLDIRTTIGVSFGPNGYRYDNVNLTRAGKYKGSIFPVPTWLIEPDVKLDNIINVGNQMPTVLSSINFNLFGNTDLGITNDGRLVGFENNARLTAASHAVAAAQTVIGRPFAEWRQEGIAVKTIDYFDLRSDMSFEEVHDKLDHHNLLATPEQPFGVLVTIPPHGQTAGLQFHGQGEGGVAYKSIQTMFERTAQLLGKVTGNQFDNPLIPQAG